MKTGTIKSFDVDTGDGMITPSEFAHDVYFNKHSVEGGIDWVHVGVQVQYELDTAGGHEAKVVRQAAKSRSTRGRRRHT